MIHRRTFAHASHPQPSRPRRWAWARRPRRRTTGELVYMTPGLDLAFWRYVSEGVKSVAEENGYGFSALDSTNDPQTQLQNAQDAIARGVAGIVLSPTDSSTAPAVLQLAQDNDIPVVIADIGTD